MIQPLVAIMLQLQISQAISREEQLCARKKRKEHKDAKNKAGKQAIHNYLIN